MSQKIDPKTCTAHDFLQMLIAAMAKNGSPSLDFTIGFKNGVEVNVNLRITEMTFSEEVRA